MLNLHKVNPKDILLEPAAYHRSKVNPARAKQILERFRKGSHFPPLTLHRRPDGELCLVDGYYRLLAFLRCGITLVSAQVCEDLGQALVAGIRENSPSNGKRREGPDAVRALSLLATAIGRKINRSEAESLGLIFDDSHEVLTSSMVSMLGCPALPESLPVVEFRKTKKVTRKKGEKVPLRPRRG